MTIGFVGLGNMGGPMSANLVKAGHTVLGYDISAAAPQGIEMADSLARIAEQCGIVFTMLPNGEIVSDVIDALIPHAQPKTLFVDCSTIDVTAARSVAKRLEDAGHHPLDAPVSGGTGGAIAGTLTFMAGGSETAMLRAQPLLDIMGGATLHCGGNGAGQAAKICNNMILGATMIVTCEAFALADGLGLDREALFEVVSRSSGQSWSMNTYCPAPGVGPKSPADNNYEPGFAAGLMLKDLALSQKASSDNHIETAIGAHAHAIYEAFVAENGPGKDFSAILQVLSPGAIT